MHVRCCCALARALHCFFNYVHVSSAVHNTLVIVAEMIQEVSTDRYMTVTHFAKVECLLSVLLFSSY